MNAAIVICTRMHSRRLPGKAIKKIAGIPALNHILNRVRDAKIPIVLALPNNDAMDITDLGGVIVYRGEDDSPLHRMASVARKLQSSEWIVRITHDDILIDSATILELIGECERQGAGYGVTPGIVDGAGVEVIHRDNLIYAANKRKEPTEFVSYFVRGPMLPRPGIVKLAPRWEIKRNYRLTMDYPEDATVLEAILRVVGPNAPLNQIVSYIDENQYILNLNRLPELSIYTCVNNGSAWIGSAMLSVLAAKAIDLEHVIVDDGSIDDTLTKASIFYRGSFQKILVNEKNLGLASSSNIAVSECRGKYVMRLDADDHLLAAEFETLWPQIKSKFDSGASVVYPAYYEFGASPEKTRQDPRTNHHVGGAIFDKSFLNELRFRDGLRNWDGKELHGRLVSANAKIEYLDEPTWAYRQHSGSMSKTNLEEREKLKQELEA